MASRVPLTPRTLANSQAHDLQRISNPRLEVNERRLRPIYDFMEIHNYRKALTEIERLLKKQSNFTACKSLKCLVLLKLERHDEAENLANELQALALSTTANSVPPGDASNMDENALTFLSQYYKDLRQYDQVVRLYEAATKRDPNSEELLCSLFMAHVRMKDYRNQSLTAQRLYKLTRKTPYYNWAVISVLLQIDENAGQLKQTLYVPMALKMLEKEFFDEQNAPMRGNAGEMECLLYLHALELREDFSKALSFLSKNLDALTKSPSNESMLPEYFSHEKQLIYNFKSNQLETCYRLAKEFLREDQFLWNWFEVLFDTYFKFDAKTMNDSFDDLDEFICDSTNKNRNLHLARLEFGLRWRLFRSKNPAVELPKNAEKYFSDWFIDEIKFYVEMFGSKTAILLVFDVYRAFEHLTDDERSLLHRFFVEKFDEENLSELLNRFSCGRLCGDVHRQWLIDDNLKSIRRFIELAEKSTTSTEQSIELFLLAAMNFEQLNRSSIDLLNLLDRIYLSDPSNFDTKLYLYKLATHFNCLPVMKDLFERLEIKNIQYYSLGYLLTDHYLRVHSNYHQVRGFLRYLTNLLQVYTDDSWSQIMFCYKYGNFLRINEIRTFSDCYLSYSLVYFQSLVGSIVIDLIQNGNRYESIANLLKSSDSQLIFENKFQLNFSLRSMFYKNEENETLKLQDTRDFDIWPKIDFRFVDENNQSISNEQTALPSSRLQFDGNQSNDDQPSNYVDRILSETAGPTSYQSSSHKDSFLRKHQTIDFQQRSVLTFLRLTILNLLHSLYVQSPSTAIVRMPDEQVFQALSIIIKDFHRSVQSLQPVNMITPCEIRTILEFELLKTIPMFVRLIVDGVTINSTNNASAESNSLSSSNSTVHFDRIDQQMIEIIEHLERTYQLIRQNIEKTSFFQRCKENPEVSQSKLEFLLDFAGEQSVLEIYSIYTEFMSYIYSFHVAIRSILANLFNKTDLLVEIQENPSARPTTSKKSKKKNAEQHASASTASNENEQLKNLWNQIDKIEHVLMNQWNDVITKIRHYERFLSRTNEINNEECEGMEKELDTNSDTSSSTNFKSKAKVDEFNNRPRSSPFSLEPNQSLKPFTDSFAFDRTFMRASTARALAVGYLESLIQIRVALTNKQKNLRSRQTTG